uniref:Putative tail-host specificity protein n=1 Tax=Streptococcus phage 700P1 TaxID=350104 RepID=Q2I7P5_9VIRU|nr:putative tail-host specificity protein [Streptococcus phage 700P1]
MTQFLKGACSFVTIKYRSKDAEKVRAGCKLAFRHKGKDYWLTINEFGKKGTEVEITAYSLSLEANKEKCGAYKASSAMPIVDYFSVFDPEKSLEIGINEVSDKKLTLEWTGTDTVLARLYSLANYFDAELEFVTELNPNYSLKRHVVNIYRSGNLGGDSTGRPVRVGTELKVLGFNSNINDLYTAIDVTGKDGLKLPDKTIKDAKGEVQFFSKNGRLYAPQARDKFPSNNVNVNDGYILAEAKPTEYTDQEALFGYALSEMKKHCDVQVEYSTEGAVKGSVGDTKTLIDSINFEPTLYVQARITEKTEDLETGKSLKTTFSNFKRTSSQLSNDLTKKIEELAKSAVPYRIVMVTSNGTSFKNGTGQSIVSPKLFKGDTEITDATYRFNFNNNTVAGLNYTVNASAVNGTSVLKIDAYVGNDAVVSDELTFINVNDGLNGSNGRGITSTEDYYLVSASKIGITSATTGWVKGTPQVATATNKYHWHYHVDIYSDGTRKETVPAVIGIYGDQGIPGTPGADGKTPFWHTAWANSADGKTDFSLTDSTNKRFIGQYTDYTQADSTDPTKYKWVDMTANVKSGGINYIVKSNKQFTDKGLAATGITNTIDGVLHVESVVDNGNYLRFDWSGRYPEYLTNAENKFNENDDFTITFWCKRLSGDGIPNVFIKSGMGYYPLNGELNSTEFKPISYTGKWKKANDIYLHLGFYNAIGVFEFEKFKLEKGNIATDHSEAPEDTQLKIDSKADDALTQEQLLAIAEEQRLMKSSLEATASLENSKANLKNC